jgi:voltage-gated potassium channel
MFASIIIFVSSVLIYVMEANNPNSSINTLFDALYWSIVTISTVGYGDITPSSSEARFIAMIVITAGIAVLAFTTSLFVSAFTEKLEDIREIKMIDEISKINNFYLICGYGEIAREVVAKLIYHHNRIVIIDEDEQNILKQDALSIGADLAVPKGTVIAKEPFVNCLLIATTSQLIKHLGKN